MATVQISKIQWNILPEVVYKLPNNLVLTFDDSMLDDEDAESMISDALLEMYGFNHQGFEYEIIG